MLNIPDSVKALYKQDGVRKNFRAHFPGGELPDITNDNIVQESVKFTESICSQDVFKFGLTEASVVEFETVGVANMYGMMIECSSEIDCSSLSAAEIAEIEAGTWDGEFVPLADSDLGFPFFRVPYGVFRVESCPRDHQAMAHRRVTAFNNTDPFLKIPLEEEKTRLFFPWNSYQPNIEYLFYSAIAQNNKVDLSGYGFEKEKLVIRGSTFSEDITLMKKDGTHIQMRFAAQVGQAAQPNDYITSLGTDYIYRIETGIDAADCRLCLSEAVAALEEYGIDYETSGFSSMEELVTQCAKYRLGGDDGDLKLVAPLFLPFVAYITRKANGKRDPLGYIAVPDLTYGFYPGFQAELGVNKLWLSIIVPRSFFIIASPTGTPDTIYSKDLTTISSINVYRYSNINPQPIFGRYESTLKSRVQIQKVLNEKIVSAGYYVGHSFSDAFSIADTIKGFLELSANFCKPYRDGTFIVSHLTADSPSSVVPADYLQMWFDEYDVEPIGTVRYSYTDEAGEEQIVDYKFGDGASVYDMTDNAVLKSMDGASPAVIESMLDTYFIPHLAPINFVPIDLNMKGLPYIEAGDALTVTAQDGTVCNSYALRRELDGVQSLTDQIDSESGLIIDSEEGGT